jgi:hypothetical protein
MAKVSIGFDVYSSLGVTTLCYLEHTVFEQHNWISRLSRVKLMKKICLLFPLHRLCRRESTRTHTLK